jgi:hypothetical protein
MAGLRGGEGSPDGRVKREEGSPDGRVKSGRR